MRAIGIDPAREWLPIAPAAHYLSGGIVTDLDGATALPGLWAAGEVACTGVHGANRLASNSLLECLVFGRRAALAALSDPVPTGHGRGPTPDMAGNDTVSPEVREAMWRDAGLIRDGAGLERLAQSAHPLSRLIAKSALARQESRGGHFRTDFPLEDERFAAHTLIRAGESVELERWS